jgi:tRNA-splicing ligase RtcB (3'-phosphate/5'-hydroxy nucleic acid ligase)
MNVKTIGPVDERSLKQLEREMDSAPVLLEVGTELGDAYAAAIQLAGEYAHAGRDVVVSKVLQILSAEPVHEVNTHHDFAWPEQHRGRSHLAIRRGCTPARRARRGSSAAGWATSR